MPVLQLNGIWLEDDVRIPVDSSKKFQNNVWMIRANSSITDLLDNWDSESFWRTHRISVYQTDLQRSVPWIRCTGESSIYIRLMVHYFFAETQLASQYDQNVAGQAWLKGKLDAYQTGSSWREFHASKQQNKMANMSLTCAKIAQKVCEIAPETARRRHPLLARQ